MPERKRITASQLRELVEYDPKTGIFTARVRLGGVVAGSVLGCINDGYRVIGLLGRLHLGHRLAWLYVEGVEAPNFVDHINGNRDDNRRVNLRSVTNAQNMQNEHRPRANSTTKLLGVRKTKTSWVARISVSGVSFRLGTFKSAAEASEAYLKAKAIHHPFWVKQPTEEIKSQDAKELT